MRTFKHSVIILLILGGLVLIVNQAFLYSSTTTHPYLVEQMVKFYNYYYEPDITPEQLEKMKQGSTHEDFGDRSWFFHFYDPIYNVGTGELTAKEWAQNPEKQANTPGGDHSWQTAITEYNAGYKQKAFYSLGHILHLIEDMAVPAHTREDAHQNGDPLEKWAGDLPHDSDFYNIADPLYKNGIKPKIFNNLDSYFDEVANFSNKNFFSKQSIEDTMVEHRYFGPKIVKEGWENGQKYGYGKVEGVSKLIRLLKIKTEDGKKIYFLDHTTPEIHADYFSILSKQAVIHGAGVVKLFFDSITEPATEIVEPAQQLSFWQKFGNTIVGATKFVMSVIDGLIHTPPSAIESAVEESMPEPEYMGTIGTFIPEVIDEVLGETESAETPVVNESYEVEPRKVDEVETFLVKRVIDGDTIILEDDKEVRYIGIDAPEFPNGCFAKEATDKNRELIEGKQVRLEKDISETDVYGRALRYIYLDSLFINDYLVRNGYAYDFAYEPDIKFKEQFFEAEKEAKENRRGLWGDVCQPIIVQGPATGGDAGISGKLIEEMQAAAQNQNQQNSQEPSVVEASEDEQSPSVSEEVFAEVVINEIAWMGTQANHNDEWIELYNRTNDDIDLTGWTIGAEDGTPVINLEGTIFAQSYFLLERTNDETVANVQADQIYTGALNNEGEDFKLKDNNENTVDQVDCSDNWYAGENENLEGEWMRKTMERINPELPGNVSSSWQTYIGAGSEAIDADGNLILGTPKAENSSSESGEDEEEDEEEGEEGESYTIINQNILEDTVWTRENSPYLVYAYGGGSQELLEIAEGVTLTIEPGVIIKFVNPGIKVYGTIIAEGEAENPIVFTDYNDKEYAGNIFGSEANPGPGTWSGIWITPSSNGSIFDNVIIRYAGSRIRPFRSAPPVPFVGAAIRVEDASATIMNSTIEYNLFTGVWLINSPNTVIENSTFQNHLEYDNSYTTMNTSTELRNKAIYIDSSSPQIRNSTFQNNLTGIYIINNSAPVIENNNFSNNYRPIWVENSYPQFSENQLEGNQWDGIVLKGLKLNQDYVLGDEAGELVFINYEEIPSWGIVVPVGYTLTIEPGTIIKSLQSTAGLIIEGTLIAEGTEDEPIVFTSIYDEYGGDTNGDSEEIQAGPGSWGQIVFNSTSTDSSLNYVIIRYGGTRWGQSYNFAPDYVLKIDNTDIAIANSIFENNTSGARLENSNSQIANTEFRDHQYSRPFSYFTSTGLYLSSSAPTIDISTFLNNSLGIYIDVSSWLEFAGLIFENNSKDFEDMRPPEEGF